MASSTQRIVSDGTLRVVNISIGYMDRSEISVYFDSFKVLPPVWGWVGDVEKRIEFASDVPAGIEVLIKRTTDITQLRHYFSRGAAFTAEYLDEDLKQVLQVVQEATEANFGADFFQRINMHGNRIVEIADGVEANDAVNVGQMIGQVAPYTNAAEDAAASARLWAVKPDDPVEGSLYSSRYYAAQAGGLYQAAINAVAAISLPIPVSSGGTGSTTASDARTALGLGTAAVADVGNSVGQLPAVQSGGKLNPTVIPYSGFTVLSHQRDSWVAEQSVTVTIGELTTAPVASDGTVVRSFVGSASRAGAPIEISGRVYLSPSAGSLVTLLVVINGTTIVETVGVNMNSNSIQPFDFYQIWTAPAAGNYTVSLRVGASTGNVLINRRNSGNNRAYCYRSRIEWKELYGT